MAGTGLLCIVSGPSGAGKTSLCKELMAAVSTLSFSVSYTTRPQRKGEVDGTDYFFVDEERFKAMVQQGDFAEWAEVYGNLYGTTKACIEEALKHGVDLLFDVEPQGARNLKEHYPQAVSVLVLPPSAAVLEQRLRTRGTDAEEVIKRRLENARKEINQAQNYDYLVINEDFDDALQVLQSIFIAEKNRGSRIRESVSWFKQE